MITSTRRAGVRAVSSAGLALALPAFLASGCAPAGRTVDAPVPAGIRESVGYLTAAYHVSAADAMRRLRLAAAGDGLIRRLSAALPDEYAGARIDQRDGGVLVVAATRPARARRVVHGLEHHDEIKVVPAAYSLRDLARVRDRAAALTGREAYAQVNEASNRVEVWTAHRARVTRALTGLGPVVVRTEPEETLTECSVFECDPPMRAGISIGIGKKSGRRLDYCSSAFNLKDDDGGLYTTTAGHCFTELERKGKKPATIVSAKDHAIIGDIKNDRSVYANTRTPRLDYAFARVTDPGMWFPSGHSKNALYFKCSAEPQPKKCKTRNEDPTFKITGIKPYGGMIKGDVVCMAGASPRIGDVKPGTRCGEITDKPAGGIQTNICAKSGDSGSPLFDQSTHKAYGIESAVEGDDTGPCVKAEDQKTYYTPLSEALAAAHAAKGRTYELIAD
ncbi:hypothetical protein [Actinoallomurus iriomotensis]|uniref:Streptogrisin C n=1 Tax=Actinoallomurus iriomotensis TaxID=478107 RepID=A0A9W6RRJ0_9ACTN|nr:hypothetical protein [Actinoallomurus iriomotensis]GLY81221.1 hypothetical protein Airi01_094880 [Actinoallomurus iriomotensis]